MAKQHDPQPTPPNKGGQPTPQPARAGSETAKEQTDREKAEASTPGGPGGRLAHAGDEAGTVAENPENVGRMDSSTATGSMPKLAGSPAAQPGAAGGGEGFGPSGKPPTDTASKGQSKPNAFEVGGKQDARRANDADLSQFVNRGEGRPPRRAADAPFDLHVLAEDAAGNDVTVNELVGVIREIVADLRAGDVYEAMGDVGTLLGYAQMIFGAGQARTFTSSVQGRQEAFRQFREFDKAVEEFDKVKAAMLNRVASADVSTSGAARGIGDGQFGVSLTPGDFAAIIGVVQTVIDLVRKLREKRGA